MRIEKSLLKDEQYKNARGYLSRVAIFDFAVKKFNLWDWTASHYDFSQAKSVLEVGCGTGDFWQHVRTVIENIILTDFSEGMLTTAHETLADSPLLSKITFQVADVENLPFSDNSFDATLAHLMLYHAKSQDKALAEITRTLKKHGWVGISTLNKNSNREILALANKVDPRFPASSVLLKSFDEEIADQLLPQHFKYIQKYREEVLIRILDVETVVEFIRTHPVSQTLGLNEDFFKLCRAEAQKVMNEKGYLETTCIPVLYVCS